MRTRIFVTRARRVFAGSALGLMMLLVVAAVHGQDPEFVPNGTRFANPGGTSSTFSTTGNIDLTGPFFKSLGTNGRSCATCHQPGDGMSVSAAHIQERFDATSGLDPIFRTVDGSNCNHDVEVSTKAGRSAAYSLLRTRGLIRIGIAVPANADFDVVDVDNPYGCSEKNVISMYRRPLPTTNLPFLSAVMWDGRESSGARKILFGNYPDRLLANLAIQSLDATNGHAEGDGTHPTADEQRQIVDFEMALFTAQSTGTDTDRLNTQGATGGPGPLVRQPFFISINSSVNFLLPQFEQPGGLVTPGDGQFTPAVFNTFDAWARLPRTDPRAAVARGQALFNSKPITITGVAGINDDVAAGGLLAGGVPALNGTCGTCHDTPNVGNHSFPTPLNIGVGDPAPGKSGKSGKSAALSMGGLDISYLPTITVCRKGNSHECVTTTDLGQALIDGKFDHVGKLKGPILRGLSARAPYFHNGSARTLLEAVRFYEARFGLVFSSEEEADLVAFLSVL
jgi:cytochrome c peroxidase